MYGIEGNLYSEALQSLHCVLQALDKAKEAGRKERLLCKQRDQASLNEQINLDLTYSVSLLSLFSLCKICYYLYVHMYGCVRILRTYVPCCLHTCMCVNETHYVLYFITYVLSHIIHNCCQCFAFDTVHNRCCSTWPISIMLIRCTLRH